MHNEMITETNDISWNVNIGNYSKGTWSLTKLGSTKTPHNKDKKKVENSFDKILSLTKNNIDLPKSRSNIENLDMNLSFNDDVFKERCIFALPYDEKFLKEAFKKPLKHKLKPLKSSSQSNITDHHHWQKDSLQNFPRPDKYDSVHSKESSFLFNSGMKTCSQSKFVNSWKYPVENSNANIKSYDNKKRQPKRTRHYDQEELISNHQILNPKRENSIIMNSDNRCIENCQDVLPSSQDKWLTKSKKSGSIKHKSEAEISHGDMPNSHWTVETHLPGAISFDVHEKKSKTYLDEIFDEWLKVLNLHIHFKASNHEDLIKGIRTSHMHIQLKAIHIAALELKDKLVYEDSQINSQYRQILSAVEDCLLSSNEIQVTAALFFYYIGHENELAKKALFQALNDKQDAVRWTASQCLAHNDECNSDVVYEIFHKYLNSTSESIKTKAMNLLSKLSLQTTLVHSILGEQLNSSSWQHRLAACNLLPFLKGKPNKDMINKLLNLMWNDWNADIKKCSIQALAKSGHSKEIHNDFLKKICSKKENHRLEAISKIGKLKIMTGKLIPAFLQCFEDDYISVRKEVCMAVMNLNINDDSFIEKLLHMVKYDSSCDIRILALKALGKLDIPITEAFTDCILTSFKYENNENIKIEACNVMRKKNMKSDEVIGVLRSRIEQEDNVQIKDAILKTLKSLNINLNEENDVENLINSETLQLKWPSKSI